jgi:hypothetical protein
MMGKDHLLQRRQVNLRVNVSSLAIPASWTGMLQERNGRVDEHEASCESGKFQCTGDGAWCTAQKKIVCQATRLGEGAFAELSAEAVQSALQPTEEVDIASSSDDEHELGFMQRRSRPQGSQFALDTHDRA